MELEIFNPKIKQKWILDNSGVSENNLKKYDYYKWKAPTGIYYKRVKKGYILNNIKLCQRKNTK